MKPPCFLCYFCSYLEHLISSLLCPVISFIVECYDFSCFSLKSVQFSHFKMECKLMPQENWSTRSKVLLWQPGPLSSGSASCCSPSPSLLHLAKPVFEGGIPVCEDSTSYCAVSTPGIFTSLLSAVWSRINGENVVSCVFTKRASTFWTYSGRFVTQAVLNTLQHWVLTEGDSFQSPNCEVTPWAWSSCRTVEVSQLCHLIFQTIKGNRFPINLRKLLGQALHF